MSEPITIQEAASHLRMDAVANGGALARYTRDAREWVERYTGHLLVARDVTEAFRAPRSTIELTAWPVFADTTIAADADDVAVPTRLDASRRPARVTPHSASWPFPSPHTQLRITVRAGYRTSEEIPGNMRRAMLVLIGAYDADREGGEIFAAAEMRAKSLCRSYRKATV